MAEIALSRGFEGRGDFRSLVGQLEYSVADGRLLAQEPAPEVMALAERSAERGDRWEHIDARSDHGPSTSCGVVDSLLDVVLNRWRARRDAACERRDYE